MGENEKKHREGRAVEKKEEKRFVVGRESSKRRKIIKKMHITNLKLLVVLRATENLSGVREGKDRNKKKKTQGGKKRQPKPLCSCL